MSEIKNYIESGILESYVLGLASEEEVLHVEAMAATHSQIRDAIDEFAESLEQSALANAVVPDTPVKAFIMAAINYTQRLQNGEEPGFPPPLNEESKVTDYSVWLNRADMVLPTDFNDSIHARIIGYTPEVLTAIIWIKDYAPTEVHHNEFEKFLIVEGSCNIAIEDEVYEMTPGDYMQIPLYQNHRVTITSGIPCKIILQRVAA